MPPSEGVDGHFFGIDPVGKAYCLPGIYVAYLCVHVVFRSVSTFTLLLKVAQWLCGGVLDSRPRGCGFEPHRRHCVLVPEQDTYILA